MCASKEKVNMIQGIQSVGGAAHGTGRSAAARSVLTGFGKEDIEMTRTDAEEMAIALSIICRHLDSMRQIDGGEVGQLCQFVGGEGGTGKSRVIEALVELFAAKGIASRLLITATSGTAAARVNGVTTKDQGPGANTAKDVDGVRLPKQVERFVNGQSRIDWQEKHVLVIDEVSMLGARTLHAVNERLYQLRGRSGIRLDPHRPLLRGLPPVG
ncbi:hypothetical protein CDD83_10265 [Cordyceps sp. RAO-2017]|nr:hypothetical protein CDD83_10265 [Cordyceps sp. RAO-2017]